MYPALPKSYKGLYPFKIGTTSFIYPDSYVPNVKMLGPFLDEIELLLFESISKDSLPSKSVIKELAALSKEFDLSYNIHLPIDIYLSDHDPSKRHNAVETIKRVIDLTLPLSPSASILHLPYNEDPGNEESVSLWQERIYQGFEQLSASGIGGELLSIETLTYQVEWIGAFIKDFNLSVCIDLGHLIMHGFDIKAVFNKYSEQTSIIHLHGVENGQDHRSLDRLSKKEMDHVIDILTGFMGVVSLEVFSFKDLDPSLKFLEQCWQRYE